MTLTRCRKQVVDFTSLPGRRLFGIHSHSASRSLAAFLARAVTKGSVTMTYCVVSTPNRTRRMSGIREQLSRIQKSFAGQPRSIHKVSVSSDLETWACLQQGYGASRCDTTLGGCRRRIKIRGAAP